MLFFDSYLYIARTHGSPIVRYSPANQAIVEFHDTTGSAQSISVDKYNAIYWCTYNQRRMRIMKTLMNGTTFDFDVKYDKRYVPKMASDDLNLYVLDQGNNRIDIYLKSSLEKQGNIRYTGEIKDLIIAYGKFHVLHVGIRVHVRNLLQVFLQVFNGSFCNSSALFPVQVYVF